MQTSSLNRSSSRSFADISDRLFFAFIFASDAVFWKLVRSTSWLFEDCRQAYYLMSILFEAARKVGLQAT